MWLQPNFTSPLSGTVFFSLSQITDLRDIEQTNSSHHNPRAGERMELMPAKYKKHFYWFFFRQFITRIWQQLIALDEVKIACGRSVSGAACDSFDTSRTKRVRLTEKYRLKRRTYGNECILAVLLVCWSFVGVGYSANVTSPVFAPAATIVYVIHMPTAHHIYTQYRNKNSGYYHIAVGNVGLIYRRYFGLRTPPPPPDDDNHNGNAFWRRQFKPNIWWLGDKIDIYYRFSCDICATVWRMSNSREVHRRECCHLHLSKHVHHSVQNCCIWVPRFKSLNMQVADKMWENVFVEWAAFFPIFSTTHINICTFYCFDKQFS